MMITQYDLENRSSYLNSRHVRSATLVIFIYRRRVGRGTLENRQNWLKNYKTRILQGEIKVLKLRPSTS